MNRLDGLADLGKAKKKKAPPTGKLTKPVTQPMDKPQPSQGISGKTIMWISLAVVGASALFYFLRKK